MNFISRLLGKRTDNSASATPDQISSADLIDLSLGKIKTSCALNELNDEVRKLPYGPDLITLAEKEGKLQGFALQHISSLLDSNSSNLRQVRRDFPNLSHQLTIASFSKTPKILDSVLSEVADENTLVKLCENSPTSSVRIKLIEKIRSYEALKRLEKAFKNKDKSSLKTIKSKLEAIKNQRAEEEAFEQKKTQIMQALSDHSKRHFNVEYISQFESLKRKVNRLDLTIEDPWLIDAQALLDVCKTTIDKEAAATRNTPKNDTKENETADKPDLSLAKQYCEHVSEMLNPEHQADMLLKLQERQEDLASQCEDTFSQNPNTEDTFQELKLLTEAIEAYLFLIKEDQDYKQALNNLISASADAKTIQDSIRQIKRAKNPITKNTAFKRYVGVSHLCSVVSDKEKQLESIEKKEQEENRKIVGLIRKAQFAIKNGRLKQAQGIRRNISELIDSKEYLPTYLERQWTSLTEEIEELGDWHTYAALPKLQSLLEEIRKLSQKPEAPELQATKIKRLQNEWKSVSKGSAGKHQELWQEFKSLSDQAYKVCEQHYARLDQEREENTVKSEALIEQLQLYIEKYDWTEANWSEVEKVVSSAKNEWRQHKPVFKDKIKQLQALFNDKIDAIQTHLNKAYAKNKAEKVRLIESLKALIDSKNLDSKNDLDAAIELTLKYQQQWKKIGHCQRREDQTLWQSFRESCDQVFQKRDEQRAQYRKVGDSAIKEAESVIAETLTIHNSTDDFKSRFAELDSLKERFESIENIPEKVQKALAQKFYSSCEKVEQKNQNIDIEKRNKEWSALFSYKENILSALTNEDGQEANRLLEELHSKNLNAACTKAILESTNVQSTRTESTTVQSANVQSTTKPKTNTAAEDYYRLLCVKVEVFTDKPSVEEDKDLRMQFQVEHLQSSFGERTLDAFDLIEQWLKGPVIDDTAYKSLAARFVPNWKQLRQTQGGV